MADALVYCAGGYRDETGLTKFGTRYYDPSVGRWTQRDPSGQDANSYAYVACNPVNAVDPSGLEAEPGDCPSWLQTWSRALGVGDAVRAGYYGSKGDWSHVGAALGVPTSHCSLSASSWGKRPSLLRRPEVRLEYLRQGPS